MINQTVRHSWLVPLALALSACSDKSSSVASEDEQAAMVPESARPPIEIYGASGRIGGLIVTEALDRGHSVIGVSRSPEKFTINHPSFSAVKGDVTSVESFREVTDGADAVIIRPTEGGNYTWGQGGWDRSKADAVAICYLPAE